MSFIHTYFLGKEYPRGIKTPLKKNKEKGLLF